VYITSPSSVKFSLKMLVSTEKSWRGICRGIAIIWGMRFLSSHKVFQDKKQDIYIDRMILLK